MTLDQLKELFEWCSDHDDECEKLALKHQTTTRQDLDALKLLNTLCPAKATYKGNAPDLISAAEHDQIWFATELEDLAAAATKEQIKTLSGFGVWLDSNVDALSMFV